MKLIVGLGNPGKEYEGTRHNVGFMVVDNFAASYGVSIEKEKFSGKYNEIFVDGEKIILLKPCSYMNLSGEVVKKYVDYFNVDISNILIISDDLDLPVAKYRLRAFGSSGGHNGLKNIESMLGSNKFKRFRIGISKDKRYDTKDYVLGKFSLEDKEQLDELFTIFNDILNDYCVMNFDKLMNKYN